MSLPHVHLAERTFLLRQGFFSVNQDSNGSGIRDYVVLIRYSLPFMPGIMREGVDCKITLKNETNFQKKTFEAVG